VIYEQIKDWLLTVLRAPRHPPDPPAGSRESVQIFRAAPNFLTYQIVMWGLGFAVGILAAIVFVVIGLVSTEKDSWVGLVLGYLTMVVAFVGAVIKYFLIRIDYDMRYYVVTDRSLRIRQGALLIDESTFTFANVQNLKIHQGPIERLLGLSNLIVETAGGAGSGANEGRGQNPFKRGHEGRMRGVANAREVRDQILKLLKRYRDAGLGDPEDRHRAVLASRPPGGLSPQGLVRLREVRDELRKLGTVTDSLKTDPRDRRALP
jgi:membrane protein YdbS with pleckstrin-like domain